MVLARCASLLTGLPVVKSKYWSPFFKATLMVSVPVASSPVAEISYAKPVRFAGISGSCLLASLIWALALSRLLTVLATSLAFLAGSTAGETTLLDLSSLLPVSLSFLSLSASLGFVSLLVSSSFLFLSASTALLDFVLSSGLLSFLFLSASSCFSCLTPGVVTELSNPVCGNVSGWLLFSFFPSLFPEVVKEHAEAIAPTNGVANAKLVNKTFFLFNFAIKISLRMWYVADIVNLEESINFVFFVFILCIIFRFFFFCQGGF